MSESEGFLARWSRMKRDAARDASAVGEKRADSLSGADALPGADAPPSAPFDPASLPPIESIVSDTDMRQFLQASVPAELTRAALRSAWTADPAIRDFVGIADNQWDFNEPAGIPGFGALGPGDYARGLVARALGSVQEGGAAPDHPEAVQNAAAPRIDPQSAEPDEVRQVVAPPARGEHGADLTARIAAGQVVEAGVHPVPQDEDVCAANRGPRAMRSHGGALPT